MFEDRVWTVTKKGFLPSRDPCTSLKNYEEYDTVEWLAKELPYLISTRFVREELVAELRALLRTCQPIDLINRLQKAEEIERAMMLFSYFASAFIHAKGETSRKVLPYEIAQPFVLLAQKVGRPPILSYASYCLYNWERIDTNSSVNLWNVRLLQNFTLENKHNEDGFILIHTGIEAAVGEAVYEILKFCDFGNFSIEILDTLSESLDEMNYIMELMPDYCDVNFYYNEVRPYIFGFKDVIYQDCFHEPRTYRGETGAQSSIIPLCLKFLGIEHEDNMLTQHLNDMRQYMPLMHRKLLDDTPSIREFAMQDQATKELYNQCVKEVVRFRKIHLEYAVNYIEKKVDNPEGTGGTPYIPWLSKLIEETERYVID